MTKVLILGSKGMLGQELERLFEGDEKYEVTAWDREDIDVTDFGELRERVTQIWPDVIYNAVAYNAVDACEEDERQYEMAKKLNVEFPAELARIAKTLQATVVHYSTDYVFDGERPAYKDGTDGPDCCGSSCRGCQYRGDEEGFEYFSYAEDDLPKPLSNYGKSKYEGEQMIEKNAGSHFYIFRLSKLFGKPATSEAGKKSFFDVMLAKGKEEAAKGGSVTVVDGEMSKFTYAPDLASESKKIVEDHEESGIYHIVNDGASTWYEGALTLYKIAGVEVEVKPVPPETFPRPAKRPASSVLAVTKRSPLRHYEDALREYLSQ